MTFHLCLGFPSEFFPSSFPTTIMYEFVTSSMRSSCSDHLVLLHLINLTTLMKNTQYEAPHYAVFSIRRLLLFS